jgi:hypothetical protein
MLAILTATEREPNNYIKSVGWLATREMPIAFKDALQKKHRFSLVTEGIERSRHKVEERSRLLV